MWSVRGTAWSATRSMGHWWCAMRSMQALQPSPCNILDKSTGEQMVQGRNLDADCTGFQTVLTGMCLTSCLIHSGQPHGSHSHIRAQWISGVTHKEPSPTASQNADVACPPWAISR